MFSFCSLKLPKFSVNSELISRQISWKSLYLVTKTRASSVPAKLRKTSFSSHIDSAWLSKPFVGFLKIHYKIWHDIEIKYLQILIFDITYDVTYVFWKCLRSHNYQTTIFSKLKTIKTSTKNNLKWELMIWRQSVTCKPVFFNLGSVKPRGSSHSSLGSVRILKFWVSRFHQTHNNVSKSSATLTRFKHSPVECSLLFLKYLL